MSTKRLAKYDAIEAEEIALEKISPAAILEAMENPEVFERVARGDLLVQLHHLRQAARSPEIPLTQRVELSRFLAKMGKVEQPEKATNPFADVPLIEIDLGQGQSVRIGGQNDSPADRPPPRSPERDVTPRSPGQQSRPVNERAATAQVDEATEWLSGLHAVEDLDMEDRALPSKAILP
jgi:hypothetical protein